jgi:hypothetical protein
MDTKTRNSLIVFPLLTFALSSIFYVRSFAGAPLEQVAPLLMWTPGVSALITQLMFHRTLPASVGALGRGAIWHRPCSFQSSTIWRSTCRSGSRASAGSMETISERCSPSCRWRWSRVC